MCTIPSARASKPPEPARRVFLVSLVSLVSLAVLATPLVTRSAHAAETNADVLVHVEVDAPATCTDEEKLWKEVSSRTSELRRVPETAETPRVVARAWQERDAVRGELQLRTARGETLPPRAVVGRTCTEVTAALALALVLALEEGALESARQENAVDSARQENAVDSAPSPPSSPHAPSPASPRVAPSAHEVRRPRAFAPSIGARASLVNAGGLAAGASVNADFTFVQLGGRVSIGVEAVTWLRTVDADGRRHAGADLRWAFMRARICVNPLRALGLELALCGIADGGAFTAAAPHARNPRSYVAPWAGAGVAVDATWRVSRAFGLALEGGAVLPFVFDDLVVRPNVRVYSTPSALTWVAFGPVVHFD